LVIERVSTLRREHGRQSHVTETNSLLNRPGGVKNAGETLAGGEILMRYSQLSGQQMLSELSDSYKVISAITKYQAALASGTGLPVDDPARIELMAANLNVVERIRTEIRALEHELDHQEQVEKLRY
jgi:hypothetical protein